MPSLLYDSEHFTVIHNIANNDDVTKAMRSGASDDAVKVLISHIYQIVDKRAEKEVCLFGEMAENFLELTNEWKRNAPTPEIVEDVLDGYSQIAQLPCIVH